MFADSFPKPHTTPPHTSKTNLRGTNDIEKNYIRKVNSCLVKTEKGTKGSVFKIRALTTQKLKCIPSCTSILLIYLHLCL